MLTGYVLIISTLYKIYIFPTIFFSFERFPIITYDLLWHRQLHTLTRSASIIRKSLLSFGFSPIHITKLRLRHCSLLGINVHAYPWGIKEPKWIVLSILSHKQRNQTNTHTYQASLCMGFSQLSSVQPSSCTSSFCIRAFVYFCWFGLLISFVVCGNNETDRLALLEFKAKIADVGFRSLNTICLT